MENKCPGRCVGCTMTSDELVSITLTREQWGEVSLALVFQASEWSKYGAQKTDEAQSNAAYRISNRLLDISGTIDDILSEPVWDGTTARDAEDECMDDDAFVEMFGNVKTQLDRMVIR